MSSFETGGRHDRDKRQEIQTIRGPPGTKGGPTIGPQRKLGEGHNTFSLRGAQRDEANKCLYGERPETKGLPEALDLKLHNKTLNRGCVNWADGSKTKKKNRHTMVA